MQKETVIGCSHLYKRYPLYHGDAERLKGLLLPGYKPEEFTALRDVNLQFQKGEIAGLIGLNGSGKSTFASIIAGITYPSEGEVRVRGEVNMLAANAGMESHLTGVENIRYKCILLGFTPQQIRDVQDDIIAFADIGTHIDQPVRTYSSGMRSRLGFAISVHMNPDILIIDEALAVGDNSFTDKCLAKMEEFKKAGKTILFVSHAVAQMQDFCDKVIWLNRGAVVGEAPPEEIIKPYCGFAREFNMMTHEERLNLTFTLQEYQEKYL